MQKRKFYSRNRQKKTQQIQHITKIGTKYLIRNHRNNIGIHYTYNLYCSIIAVILYGVALV